MTLVSKIAFASSAVKASVTPTDAMPALLTSTSILPTSARIEAMARSTEPSSVTSSSTTSIFWLRNASAWLRLRPAMSRIEANTR